MGGSDGGAEGRLQQVAARRRFPVEHLAGDERAGHATQHERLVDLGECDPAGTGDGACDRHRRFDGQRHAPSPARQAPTGSVGTRLPVTSRSSDIDTGASAIVRRKHRSDRVLRAPAAETLDQLFDGEIRLQVDRHRASPVAIDRVADDRGVRVHRPALDAVTGDHRVAAHGRVADSGSRCSSAARRRTVRRTAASTRHACRSWRGEVR